MQNGLIARYDLLALVRRVFTKIGVMVNLLNPICVVVLYGSVGISLDYAAFLML